MSTDYKSRKDFIWGVNGHNRSYPAYPEKHLEEQIKLAAELGVKCYRINCTPEDESSFKYLDKVVLTCEKYGLSVFLVIYDRTFIKYENPQELYDGAKRIAEHYKGKISMYQISNEQDIPALDLEHLQGPIGNDIAHYSEKNYADIKVCMEKILNGINDGDPDAKTVINISWRHTAVLDMFARDGLKWDITGLDWYWALDDNGHNNVVETIEHLASLPAKDIIVAEANSWEGDFRMDEQAMSDYNLAAMDFYYNYPDSKIKGFFIYQLFDEADKEYGEGHFGLVKCDISGNTGRKKISYNTISQRLNNKEAK